jgi:ribosomal protein S18 acetylase RimI-like enzyme
MVDEAVMIRRLDPRVASIEHELDVIDRLLMRAYGSGSRRSRVKRFLAIEPDGWFVADRQGVIVGAGGSVAYPDGGFGWVGLIATAPEGQGHGIGRRVTEACIDHLRERGCAAVLDGSASGAPLYEKMGFRDHGLSVMFEADLSETGVPATQPRVPVSRLNAADAESIGEFDRIRFGANRTRLLRVLLNEFQARAFVVPGRGYVIAQDDMIGPFVADDPEARDALLSAALSLPWAVAPKLIVPPDSAHLAAISASGMREVRALRHQRLGIDQLPGIRSSLIAQTSFGEG